MSHENTKRLFYRWVIKLLLVASTVAAVAYLLPDPIRQKAIPAAYVFIVLMGLLGAFVLWRLSWRLMRGDEPDLPALLAFSTGTMFFCEAVEQGWWFGIRVYRYLSGGFAPTSFYDHWIIAAWIAGLGLSMAAIIVIAWRRQ